MAHVAEVSTVCTSVIRQHLGDDGLAGYQGTNCGETVPPAPAIQRESLCHPDPTGLCLGWGETIPTVPAIQRQHVFLLTHTNHHLSSRVSCSLLRGKGTMGTFACHPVVLSARPGGGPEEVGW